MHRRAVSCCPGFLGGLSRRAESSKFPHPRVQSSLAPSSRNTDRPRQHSRHEDHARLENLTKKIIDTTAREPAGWRQTPSLRGPEKRLTAVIKSAQNVRAPSTEQMAYNAGEDTIEGEGVDVSDGSIALGTFVETRRNEISTHGVAIGEEYVDRRWRVVTLMSSGELWTPVRDDILFAIPALTPADLAIRCGTREIATKETELRARVEVLKRLRHIERAVEDAYNLVCRRNTNIYSAIKSPDPEKWSKTTVAEVAQLSTPNPNLITLFATHKFLMNNSTHFVAHPTYRTTQAFGVRPQSHVDELESIKVWSRLRDGPIQAFARKARGIIEFNQNLHKESGGEVPSQSPAGHSWTTEDQVVLSFLLRSLRPYRSTQIDPYSLGQSTILKCIDPNGPPVGDDEVHKVLVNLGVLAPWQDLLMLTPDLNLDLEDEATSPQIKAQDASIIKTLSSPLPQKGPLGPEDFYPSDPLESVRHDFSDTPVYVIDDAHAEELDDGVSLERIPSEPGNFWVHVHIADPGSVIPPTHFLAQQAALRGDSIYFIQRSWPLFPRTLIHSPQHGLSLGSKPDIPDRVLSFSAKVDAQGEILDYKVRAGIIRNIHILTYDGVDAALGSPPVPRSYPFGGGTPRPSPASLTESQIEDLQDLSLIARRLVMKRKKDGTFSFSDSNAEITNFARIPSSIKSPTLHPSHFRGFPKFDYSVTTTHEHDTGAHNMVAEMMKLACRSASRFSLERGLPVIRRTGAPMLTATDSDLQKVLDMRTPNGYVLFHKALPYITLSPAGDYSLEPKGHYGLGVPEGEGYVRATSPLRRYSDLVTHWQLHHALLGPSAPTKSPPFDAEWLANFIITLKNGDKMRRGAQIHHERYWLIMFMKRWMEDTARGIERRNNPLKGLYAYTLVKPRLNLDTRGYQAEVHVPTLGIRALLVNLDATNIPLATALPIDIHELRLGIRPQIKVVLRKV